MRKTLIIAFYLAVAIGVFAQESSDWDYFAYVGKNIDAALESRIELISGTYYRTKEEFLNFFNTVELFAIKGRVIQVKGRKGKYRAQKLLDDFGSLPFVYKQTKEKYETKSFTGVNGNFIEFNSQSYQYTLKESGLAVFVYERIDSRALNLLTPKYESTFIVVYDPLIVEPYYLMDLTGGFAGGGFTYRP